MESRQYTTGEARENFLRAVRDIVQYWETIPNPSGSRESGVAFSILTLLDGCNGEMPGFVVAPAPHPSDRAYHQERGENYYPEAPEVECDIAGCLHEQFFRPAESEEQS